MFEWYQNQRRFNSNGIWIGFDTDNFLRCCLCDIWHRWPVDCDQGQILNNLEKCPKDRVYWGLIEQHQHGNYYDRNIMLNTLYEVEYVVLRYYKIVNILSWYKVFWIPWLHFEGYNIVQILLYVIFCIDTQFRKFKYTTNDNCKEE